MPVIAYTSQKKPEKVLDLNSKQLVQFLFSFNKFWLSGFLLLIFSKYCILPASWIRELSVKQSASNTNGLKRNFLMVGIILKSFKHSLGPRPLYYCILLHLNNRLDINNDMRATAKTWDTSTLSSDMTT